MHINGDTSAMTQVGISNTSTGEARIYFDASNGDFSGNDYFSIGQQNDLNGIIDLAPAADLRILTNGSEAMRIDSNGNFGFNAIPENSSGTWRNFQLGSLSMASRSNDSNPDAMFGTNFKFTTANAEQRISAHATSRLFFNDDVITFQNAASGAADSGNKLVRTYAHRLKW